MRQLKDSLLAPGGLAIASFVALAACSSTSSPSGSGGAAGEVSSSGSTSTGGSSGDNGAGGTGIAGGGANGGGAVGDSGSATGGASGSAGSSGSDAGGASGAGGGPPLNNPRITLLGDSTTSDGCFRAHLSQMLTSAGHAFSFVGTRTGNPGCIGTFNQINEGHGGYIVADVLKTTSTGRPGGADASDPFVSSAADLMTWFDGHPTDVVLMNFGTNDVSNNIATQTIINAFTAILMRLRMNNPNVRMMVAQIPPINWQFCIAAVCDPRVNALNAAVVTWAAQQNTAESPVSAVDLHTGYNDATDTVDGVHANESGSTKIANAWYAALMPLF